MERLGRLVTALRALLMASVAGGAATLAGTLPSGPAAAQAGGRDEADWLAARADGSQRAFERYLQRHPVGRHASEAFVTVARMQAERGWRPDPGASSLPEPAAGPAVAASDPGEVY